MPLKSDLLKGSQQLQACLVDHAAHVVPGSTGPHVRLIQLALICIDKLDISEAEYEAKRYGPSTAVAVLAYKKKRRIINKSYESTEDNIVGKMTVASFDNELFALEQVPLSRGRFPLQSFRPGGLTRASPVIPIISRANSQRAVADARGDVKV